LATAFHVHVIGKNMDKVVGKTTVGKNHVFHDCRLANREKGAHCFQGNSVAATPDDSEVMCVGKDQSQSFHLWEAILVTQTVKHGADVNAMQRMNMRAAPSKQFITLF
jgi:hypothetical protein